MIFFKKTSLAWKVSRDLPECFLAPLLCCASYCNVPVDYIARISGEQVFHGPGREFHGDRVDKQDMRREGGGGQERRDERRERRAMPREDGMLWRFRAENPRLGSSELSGEQLTAG